MLFGLDIDLVIYGDKCSIKTIFQLEEELEELFLPYKFDISIFSDIDNQELLDHVDRVGKYFYIMK